MSKLSGYALAVKLLINVWPPELLHLLLSCLVEQLYLRANLFFYYSCMVSTELFRL